jgi:hypothetical protein
MGHLRLRVLSGDRNPHGFRYGGSADRTKSWWISDGDRRVDFDGNRLFFGIGLITRWVMAVSDNEDLIEPPPMRIARGKTLRGSVVRS